MREGKENLDECIRLSFSAAIVHKISKLVFFTGVGDGVKIAIQQYLSKPEYNGISIIAVSFPSGRVPASVSEVDLETFRSANVPLVRAHLPFDPMHGTFHERGVGQGLSLLGSVLEVFSGSMSLCVQAALMACDAGVISPGEHVIALTSDTSVLIRACPTCKFLTDLIVREVFCKPVILTISKKEKRQGEAEESSGEIVIEQKELTNGQSS
jgi:hypothetical protein